MGFAALQVDVGAYVPTGWQVVHPSNSVAQSMVHSYSKQQSQNTKTVAVTSPERLVPKCEGDTNRTRRKSSGVCPTWALQQEG